MRHLLKNSVRPLYRYLTNKEEKTFNHLYDKYAAKPRYKLYTDVSFLNYKGDIPDLLSFIWQFKEIFVDEIYYFETIDNFTPVIFDCGANIGIGCLYFKKIYPKSRVVAFEADPNIAMHLRNNMQKNKIEDVTIVAKAVWTDDKGISFMSDGADGGAVLVKNQSDSSSSESIESIRLKDWLDKEDKIDLLKIDIEGAELQVIEDCQHSLSHINHIFLEFHALSEDAQSLSKILNILEKNNFRYYIENIAKRSKPFVNQGREQKMDLQLNIFAINRSK